jgi:SMC interacting uncharacterized protein involved in chromosome segregation
MSLDEPLLRKTVFGYKTSDVDRLLSGRDSMLRLAVQRYQNATSALAERDNELASMRIALDEKEAELVSLRERIDGLTHDLARVRAEAGPPDKKKSELTSALLTQELGRILSTAESSAERIVNEARALSQRQIQGAERLWAEVEEERRRFASWRSGLEARMRSAQAGIAEALKQMEQVSDRIDEAIAPSAEAMRVVVDELEDLADASRPPLSVAPPRPPDDGSADRLPATKRAPDRGRDRPETAETKATTSR